MKAIRKSDGKVIEVKPAILGYIDSERTLYRASCLDFNVEEKSEITIDREAYEELCKYRRYCTNWAPNVVKCLHCGELNPDGYMCANCGKDPKN